MRTEITADRNVIDFVRQCASDSGFGFPVALLLHGRFSDEGQEHFRIGIVDEETAQKHFDAGAHYFHIPEMIPLLVAGKFLPFVCGKRMVLRVDVIELTMGT